MESSSLFRKTKDLNGLHKAEGYNCVVLQWYTALRLKKWKMSTEPSSWSQNSPSQSKTVNHAVNSKQLIAMALRFHMATWKTCMTIRTSLPVHIRFLSSNGSLFPHIFCSDFIPTSAFTLPGFHTLHSTLHTLHSTLYTLQPSLHTPHSTLYTPHSTLCTLHFTLYTLRFTHYTLHSTLTLRTLHFKLYTWHSTLPHLTTLHPAGSFASQQLPKRASLHIACPRPNLLALQLSTHRTPRPKTPIRPLCFFLPFPLFFHYSFHVFPLFCSALTPFLHPFTLHSTHPKCTSEDGPGGNRTPPSPNCHMVHEPQNRPRRPP